MNYVATIIGNFKPKTDSELVTEESGLCIVVCM